jgi:hypothetical protein
MRGAIEKREIGMAVKLYIMFHIGIVLGLSRRCAAGTRLR